MDKSLIDRFKLYIARHNLLIPEEQYLLAVSGGVDSMVLLHLMHQCQIRFSIAHCNFKLRGKESDLDETLVRQTAEKNNITCHVRSFETNNFAQTQGISVQMAARQLRQNWFLELIGIYNYEKLVTAHHLDDSLETALFNFVKGSGISGLRGIVPVNDFRISPLLFAEKREITDFARKNKIFWREDQSNESTKYKRNFIRKKVIPLLKEINPEITRTFSASSARIQSAEILLKEVLCQFEKKLVLRRGDQFEIDLNGLMELKQPDFILFEIIKKFGFNFHQVRDIIENNSQIGNLYFSPHYKLNINRNNLIIAAITDDERISILIHESDCIVKLPSSRLMVKSTPAERYKLQPDSQIGAFDLEKLSFPLQIRTWQHGDYFYPLGMNHRKKLSDFFIDEKIARNDKEAMNVIISNGKIIWVVGMRIDDRYKITPATRQVLEIKNEELT